MFLMFIQVIEKSTKQLPGSQLTYVSFYVADTAKLKKVRIQKIVKSHSYTDTN